MDKGKIAAQCGWVDLERKSGTSGELFSFLTYFDFFHLAFLSTFFSHATLACYKAMLRHNPTVSRVLWDLPSHCRSSFLLSVRLLRLLLPPSSWLSCPFDRCSNNGKGSGEWTWSYWPAFVWHTFWLSIHSRQLFISLASFRHPPHDFRDSDLSFQPQLKVKLK